MEIDVIIPFHRNDSMLRESVNSILNSSSISCRLILVDDRKHFIEGDISDLKRHKIIKAGGVGYSRALRVGLMSVTSELFAMQDSDDFSHPLRLISQVKSLIEEDADVSITQMRKVSHGGSWKLIQAPRLIDSSSFQISNLIGSFNSNSTWVSRSELIMNAHFLPENFQAIDWATSLGLDNEIKFVIGSKRHYFYRQHLNQLTKSVPYNETAFQETYKLWQLKNQMFELPPLDYYSARLICAPWANGDATLDGINKDDLIHWVDCYLNHHLIKNSKDLSIIRLILLRRLFQGWKPLGRNHAQSFLSILLNA